MAQEGVRQRLVPVRVDGREHRIAVTEVGHGDPVVFLHGNPTSSALWRDVLPLLADGWRCLAPDLIGAGASDRLPESGDERYAFTVHRAFLDATLEGLLGEVEVERLVLVGHDWGGVLAVDRARRCPVRGLAYLEAGVVPVSWRDGTGPDEELFGALRSPQGERMVLQDNVFIEEVLQAGTVRALSADELAAYRTPYGEPGEGRRAMLSWARQIPIDGEPAVVHDVVSAGADWLATSSTPKLLVRGRPGAIVRGEVLRRCRTFPAQTEVSVPGTHFLPHDSPREIAAALRGWLVGLPS